MCSFTPIPVRAPRPDSAYRAPAGQLRPARAWHQQGTRPLSCAAARRVPAKCSRAQGTASRREQRRVDPGAQRRGAQPAIYLRAWPPDGQDLDPGGEVRCGGGQPDDESTAIVIALTLGGRQALRQLQIEYPPPRPPPRHNNRVSLVLCVPH
eukprot:scaffold912_cov422-Prasinococcus_capsulatus_cf.AAC.12